MVTEKGGFSLNIKNITADDLRRMGDKEGLILISANLSKKCLKNML